MANHLDELRALRDAEPDPARRAQLDAQIARLEARAADPASAVLRLDGSQTGDVSTGHVVGGNLNAPVVQPGARATVADTVHQHFYPQAPRAAAGVGRAGSGGFELRLRREGDQLLVRAAAAGLPADMPPQPFELPFALDAVGVRRGEAAAWVAQARVITRRRPEELRRARELGQLLFRQLFTGEILSEFRSRRDRLGPGEQLRLRPHLPPELATLPWELLNDPRGGAEGSYLALDPDVSLVRAVERLPLAVAPVAGPLHLQLVLASPRGDDYPQLDIGRELRRIEGALRAPVARGALALDPPIRGPNTRDQLRDRLRDGQGVPVHLLHVIAHGDLDAEARGAGVLIFEDADGRPQPTSAEFLARLLRRQAEPPRLVMLNACLGAMPATADPASSLAGVLLRAGVPAVVAMQFDLADDAAAELARVFYGELAAGAILDQAVGEARSELRESFPARLDWLVPVLFLGPEEAPLIARRADAAGTARPAASPPATTPTVAEPTQPSSAPPPATTPAAAEPTQPSPAPPPATAPARPAELPASLRQDALIAYFSEEWARAEPLLALLVAADQGDEASREHLERCRLQLRLAQRYAEARELRQAGAWQATLGALDEIAAAQAGYPDPDGLRAWAEGQGRRAERYRRALDAAGRDDWGAVQEALAPLLAEFPDDADARRLLARAERDRYGPASAQVAAGQFDAAIELLTWRLEARADDRAALRAAAALVEDAALPAPAATRVACGELLARFGDPRPGVCELPPPFVRFAGGSFVIGISEAEHRAIIEAERKNNLAKEAEQWYKDAINSQAVAVAAFELARYPLTNAQYRLFMDAGGYRADQPWWGVAGRAWLARDDAKTIGLESWQCRTSKDRPEYWEDPRYGGARPNHPVVGINWYEATLGASYRRLAEQRALVLDADGAIAMAIPFSATPTDVTVRGPGVTWWANSKA